MKTLLAAALFALPFSAGAETVWRCGNSYAQTPCEGGTAVDANDPRTAAQIAEARRVAALERQRATEMARERQAAEKASAKAAAAAAHKKKTKRKIKNGPVQPLGSNA